MVVFDVLLLFGGIGALIFLIVRKITVSRERKEAEVRRVQLLQQEANKREGVQQNMHFQPISLNDPATKAIVDEAIDLINAIIDLGITLQFIGGSSYDGFIIPRANVARYGAGEMICNIKICIYECGDLRNYHVPEKLRANLSDKFSALDSLVRQYAGYTECDTSGRQTFTFRTKNTVALSRSTQDEEQLTGLLLAEIRKRCPGADASSLLGSIYDRKHHYYG